MINPRNKGSVTGRLLGEYLEKGLEEFKLDLISEKETAPLPIVPNTNPVTTPIPKQKKSMRRSFKRFQLAIRWFVWGDDFWIK